MPTRLILLLAGGIAASLYGQGVIDFTAGLNPLAEHRVYIDEWLNPSALAPEGNQFLIALYFSHDSDNESSLMQAGGAVGFLGAPGERRGIFHGGGRTVPTVYPGAPGFFQVKGWESVYGTTYEEAASKPAARIGKSPVFVADTRHPDSLEPNPNLVNGSMGSGRPFQGFVIAIPEPSSGILVFAGIMTTALVLRRKFFGSE